MNDHGSAVQKLKSELAQVGPTTFTSRAFKPATVRHIVLFRYKSGTTADQRAEIRRRFIALANDCTRNGKRYIQSIEAGPQSSGEGADAGFEEGFLVTFGSEGDRNYYVGAPVVTNARFFDPEHQRFKEFVSPYLGEAGVLVFDFSVPDAKQEGRHRASR